MYSYRDQLDWVKAIKIPEGGHRTMDCPFCGGHKKFTLSRLATGELLWNCFRASCNVKGRYNGQRSIAGAKAYLTMDGDTQRNVRGVALPKFTTHIENHSAVCEYLGSVNSLEAFEAGLIQIRYAPREKRVLFYNSDRTGAVGRAMYHMGAEGPKWLTYGDTSAGIAVGTGENVVIVEDAASACAVARLPNCTGFALLGTILTTVLRKTLLNYELKYILLDNDALNKAVSMQKQMRGSVFVRVSEKDPKELKVDELAATLRIPNKQ